MFVAACSGGGDGGGTGPDGEGSRTPTTVEPEAEPRPFWEMWDNLWALAEDPANWPSTVKVFWEDQQMNFEIARGHEGWVVRADDEVVAFYDTQSDENVFWRRAGDKWERLAFDGRDVVDIYGVRYPIAYLVRLTVGAGTAEMTPVSGGWDLVLENGDQVALRERSLVYRTAEQFRTRTIEVVPGADLSGIVEVTPDMEYVPERYPGEFAEYLPNEAPFESMYALAKILGEAAFGVEPGVFEFTELQVHTSQELAEAVARKLEEQGIDGFEVVADGAVEPGGDITVAMVESYLDDPMFSPHPVLGFFTDMPDYQYCFYVTVSVWGDRYLYGWDEPENGCNAAAVELGRIGGEWPDEATLVEPPQDTATTTEPAGTVTEP